MQTWVLFFFFFIYISCSSSCKLFDKIAAWKSIAKGHSEKCFSRNKMFKELVGHFMSSWEKLKELYWRKAVLVTFAELNGDLLYQVFFKWPPFQIYLLYGSWKKERLKKKLVPVFILSHTYHSDCRQLTQRKIKLGRGKKSPSCIFDISKLMFQYLCFTPTEMSPNFLVARMC